MLLGCISGCGARSERSAEVEKQVPKTASQGEVEPQGNGNPQQDGAEEDHGLAKGAGNDAELDKSIAERIRAIQAGESFELRLKTKAPPSLLNQLAHLDGKLLDLLLDGGGIDDQTISLINRLPQLEHLRLRGCRITDEGIRSYASSKLSLRVLNLPHSELTAAGIAELTKLPKLRQLRLGGSRIDDRAVREIAEIQELRSLHLIGPRITSVGLKALAKTPKLASLYIDDCPLPDAAWEDLFRDKPGLHVHIDQMHHDRDPSFEPH